MVLADRYERREARAWLAAQVDNYPFATNRFDDKATVTEFVDELYGLGAELVQVEVDAEHGNYSDTLWVKVPNDVTKIKAVLLFATMYAPDEFDEDENEPNLFRMWWD